MLKQRRLSPLVPRLVLLWSKKTLPRKFTRKSTPVQSLQDRKLYGLTALCLSVSPLPYKRRVRWQVSMSTVTLPIRMKFWTETQNTFVKVLTKALLWVRHNGHLAQMPRLPVRRCMLGKQILLKASRPLSTKTLPP